MDPGESGRHGHCSEFSGNDGITEGYWKVDMEPQFAQGREHIYIPISILLF